jgi:hypothetical protein
VPAADDLALARREVATLTGRLRCLQDELDAARGERDQHRERADTLRRSRSYRLGRVLVDLARHPLRTLPTLLRRPTPAPAARDRPPSGVPGRVYVAVGLDRAAAADLVRALRQRVLVDADHVPVVVTDQPALRDLRTPGVVLEYLPDPVTWTRHDPGGGWEALLAGRVAQLCRDHRAAGAVVVDPRDPPTLATLLDPERY